MPAHQNATRLKGGLTVIIDAQIVVLKPAAAPRYIAADSHRWRRHSKMANTNDPVASNIWTRDAWLEYERDVDDIARLSRGRPASFISSATATPMATTCAYLGRSCTRPRGASRRRCSARRRRPS